MKLSLTITAPLSRPTTSQREPAIKSKHTGDANTINKNKNYFSKEAIFKIL